MKSGEKIGRARPGPKFCILFEVGPGSDLNFNFFFGPVRMGGNSKRRFDQSYQDMQTSNIRIRILMEKKKMKTDESE